MSAPRVSLATLAKMLALAAALALLIYATIAWLEPDGPGPVLEDRIFGE